MVKTDEKRPIFRAIERDLRFRFTIYYFPLFLWTGTCVNCSNSPIQSDKSLFPRPGERYYP